MSLEELERQIAAIHAAKAREPNTTRIALLVCGAFALVFGVFMTIVIWRAASDAARSRAVTETPVPAIGIDAAPAPAPLAPEVEAKLAAYRWFLADVDATLHGVRLGWSPERASYQRWDWPVWLTPDQLTDQLDRVVALAATSPALGAADDRAVRYAEVVRAEAPAWIAAAAAWPRGGDAYAAAAAPLPASFERFGEASASWRAALPPPREPPGLVQVCLEGTQVMARAPRPAPAAVEAEAEAPARTTMFAPLAPRAFREVGVRCARAALELVEHGSATDAELAQTAMRLAMMLIAEDTRRGAAPSTYVTALGNYAQVAAYLVRDVTGAGTRSPGAPRTP